MKEEETSGGSTKELNSFPLYQKLKCHAGTELAGRKCRVLEKARKRLRRLMERSGGPQDLTVYSKGHQERRHKSAQDKPSKTLQQTAADLLFVFQRVLVVIYY